MLLYDCDLSAAVKAKRTFDVTGHYGREDVLLGLLAADPGEPLGPRSPVPRVGARATSNAAYE